jgi:hypothetical protein
METSFPPHVSATKFMAAFLFLGRNGYSLTQALASASVRGKVKK